jgi:hypothetical protein
MAATILPFRRRSDPSAPAPNRYQVSLGDDGLVVLRCNGVALDRFTADQGEALSTLLGNAALLARSDEDVLAGRVAVVSGPARRVARLLEHRGSVVRLDLGDDLAPGWFSLASGMQVDGSAARCRWTIEEPHRQGLRQRRPGDSVP